MKRRRLKLVLADGRSAEDVRFDIEVVNFFVSSAEALGIPKSVAAIYGVCFASADPLSFSDIQGRLAISAGSLSQGLRVLREVGALKEVKGAGKRGCYAPELALRRLVKHFIAGKLERQLKGGGNQLVAIAAAAPTADPAKREELLARVKTLEAWHDRVRSLLPVAKGFLELS